MSYLETCNGSFVEATEQQIKKMNRRELIEHLESKISLLWMRAQRNKRVCHCRFEYIDIIQKYVF